jgi:hypothetical protein
MGWGEENIILIHVWRPAGHWEIGPRLVKFQSIERIAFPDSPPPCKKLATGSDDSPTEAWNGALIIVKKSILNSTWLIILLLYYLQISTTNTTTE